MTRYWPRYYINQNRTVNPRPPQTWQLLDSVGIFENYTAMVIKMYCRFISQCMNAFFNMVYKMMLILDVFKGVTWYVFSCFHLMWSTFMRAIFGPVLNYSASRCEMSTAHGERSLWSSVHSNVTFVQATSADRWFSNGQLADSCANNMDIRSVATGDQLLCFVCEYTAR